MQAGRLNEIYRKHREQVDFYCVYIQEAHPTDGWQVPMNVTDDVVFDQPKSEDERAEIAEACVLRLNFEMPMLLDDVTNQVDEAYSALPERLYLLGPEGTIVWRSEQGPWGFEVDTWLAEIELIAAPVS